MESRCQGRFTKHAGRLTRGANPMAWRYPDRWQYRTFPLRHASQRPKAPIRNL